MLGVGLHAYGFMDELYAPMIFIGAQVAVIGLAYLPALFGLLTRKSICR